MTWEEQEPRELSAGLPTGKQTVLLAPAGPWTWGQERGHRGSLDFLAQDGVRQAGGQSAVLRPAGSAEPELEPEPEPEPEPEQAGQGSWGAAEGGAPRTRFPGPPGLRDMRSAGWGVGVPLDGSMPEGEDSGKVGAREGPGQSSPDQG